MKRGDLVKVYDRDGVVYYGIAVLLDVSPAKYTPEHTIYKVWRDGKQEWYDRYWTLKVFCEAK